MHSSKPATVLRGLLAIIALASSTALAPAPAGAQVTRAEPSTRPRVGLALSGGGAPGAAHIGVLKVLEELRVPVDCIAGTSMGSVVGGAFAAGTTPAEMEKVIGSTDWNEVFTDRPPRAEISIRRKQDDYKPLFAPEFGFREGAILLPKGIVTGVTIESFLRSLTEQARNVQDFSKLPIPYRAVAADISTGQAVILDHGSLALAMRASMAIPGAVAPVELNGRLLVDGGIANNLPIDVVRQLCGDVIIAVNIGTQPLKRDEITSALTIVEQLVNLLGKDSVDRQLASLTPRDVLIAPDLGDISSASFERQPEAIAIGEAAARKMADSLGRYSIPEAEYAAVRKRQIVARGGLGAVDEIRFEGIERTNPEVLAALVQSKPGEELTEEKVGADLRRIYGRGDFEAVDYSIAPGPSPALVFNVREKSIGPAYLRFGLGLASDFQGENYFNALVQYRRTWLNRLGGELVAEAQVGQTTYFYGEFYQPIEARARGFVAPYARVGQYTRGVFIGDDRVADYRVREALGGFDLGATLGTWGELRVGPMWRQFDAEVDTGSPILPDVKSNASGVRARLFADQLDTAFFGRSGHRLIVNAFAGLSELGADDDYQKIDAAWTSAHSFGRHTVQLNALAGTDLNSGLPSYNSFVLGGPFRLSGYRIGQFSGQRAVFGSLLYYNQILRLPSLLGSGVFAGASIEAGQMNGLYAPAGGSTGTLYSGSLFISAETFLGPAYFGYGYGWGGNVSNSGTFYLLLGSPGVF
jgi:NTE family protein